jgi:hypothetical protein
MLNRVFFTNRQKIAFTVSIMAVLLLLPVIVYSVMGGFYATEPHQIQSAAAVRNFLYLLLLPIYGLFLFLIFQSFRQRVQVTDDRVRFHTSKGIVMLYWHEINDFAMDYHRIGSMFNWRIRLFQVADGLKGVRFYESLPATMKLEEESTEEFSVSSIRSPHVYALKSYGIELSHDDCEEFAAIVREKTNLKPVRRSGLFVEVK